MQRLVLSAILVLSAGCSVSAAGAGTTGSVSWAFTINNTLPASAVLPGGGGGLVVVITYSNGSTRTASVPPGGTLVVPANGTAAVVNGGGSDASVGPGMALWWTATGWSTTPPAPSAGG